MHNWKHQVFLLFVLFLPVETYAGQALEIEHLMQQLANTPHPPRHFNEQRHSELLLSAIILKGTLSFTDGILTKQITQPFTERFIIEEQTLTIERTDEVKQIALSDYPPLLSFVTIFRATLQGDLDTLQTHYLTVLTGSMEHWELQLFPRDDQLSLQLNKVTIIGNEDGIQTFHIDELSGDSSILELGAKLK